MTDDRSLERAARSFIESGPTRAPQSAVEAALFQIETTSQERSRWVPWRTTMTTPARVAAAAVIGVLAIGGAMLVLGRPTGSIGGPSPTAVASASTASSPSASAVPAIPLPSAGLIGAGRYVMRMADAPVDIEFTVGSRWDSGGYYINTDRHSISFWTVPNVYADACDIATVPDTPLGGTVDDLVMSLDAQTNTDMSEPVEVVVDGHPGVRVDLSPSDERPEHCGILTLWTFPDGTPGRGIDTSSGEAGELVQPVWIIDVDGERVVFVGWASTLGQSDPNVIADVIESMTLTRR